MGNTSTDERRIDPDLLEPFITETLVGWGTPQDIAAEVATSLVAADVRGHGSHGVGVLSWYDGLSGDDEITPGARPEITEERSTTLTVDGHDALGQATTWRAVDAAISLAEETGTAVVGIRRGTHLGRIGEWAERPPTAE
jgi:uncharacterized oxidoreductase